MIPPDVVSSLRTVIPDQQSVTNAQTQPVAKAQQIADVLSNLVPGQRIMAEIQALLPNGTYRATVAQRDITLALPFSAKPGDTLELEVSESDGKLTLAFVANRSGSTAGGDAQDSVATSLSATGKLIGDLMTGREGEGKRAAPLNGSQPMVETMPKSAADLAPILKQALTQSGMFYEAHQARWVAGELPVESLRQEPQGKLPVPQPLPTTSATPSEAESLAAAAQAKTGFFGTTSLGTGQQALGADGLATLLKQGLPNAIPDDQTTQPGLANSGLAEKALSPEANLNAKTSAYIIQGRSEGQSGAATNLQALSTAIAPGNHTQPRSGDGQIPAEVQPLVRQQLDGLASNNFAWQGQIWPGQQMWWEIGEDSSQQSNVEASNERQWQSRLQLALPSLGDIEATLRLQPGGKISLALKADSPAAEDRLRTNSEQLQQQLAAAGLDLMQLQITHGQTDQ